MSTRTSCGTSNGIRLHIACGEPLCGPCAHLTLNAVTTTPDPKTEPAHIRDLRAVIAVLADAMSSKAKP